MYRVNTFIATILLCLVCLGIQAQASLPWEQQDQDGVAPTVFLIGQNESTYEQLILEHQQMLLSVCDNDMNRAYNHWLDMMVRIESFSKEVGYDLNGIKLWLNVFWNEDGTVAYFVYHPKPNSRNIDTDELSEFFKSFAPQFKSEVVSNTKFSHYGSAAFPIFPQRYRGE